MKVSSKLHIKNDGKQKIQNGEIDFKKFFENAPDYCYVISPKGKILDVNKSALNTLGYQKKGIIGKPLLITIYAPSSRKKARELFMKWIYQRRLIFPYFYLEIFRTT